MQEVQTNDLAQQCAGLCFDKISNLKQAFLKVLRDWSLESIKAHSHMFCQLKVCSHFVRTQMMEISFHSQLLYSLQRWQCWPWHRKDLVVLTLLFGVTRFLKYQVNRKPCFLNLGKWLRVTCLHSLRNLISLPCMCLTGFEVINRCVNWKVRCSQEIWRGTCSKQPEELN